MTKAQKISEMILAELAATGSVSQAFDRVLGEGAYDKLASALHEELRQANKNGIMLREALTPLVIHRHTTNDSEYRAAEKALAATHEVFQTENEQDRVR